MDNENNKGMMTIPEAVIYTGLPGYQIRQMITNKQLKAIKPSGKYFIPKKVLDDLMNGNF